MKNFTLKTLGALACIICLPCTAVAQTEQTVKMTTAKPVGESITLYVNQTKTGVTVDWGDGNPVAYPKTSDKLCQITGTVKGADIVLQGSNRLRTLICAGCGLTALDANEATGLYSIFAQNNELESISINKCADLVDLNLANNKLSSVGVTETRFANIENLNFANNGMVNSTGSGTGFVYRSASLQHVNLSGNEFKTVYFTQNAALDQLIMQDVPVAALALTNNVALTTLVADGCEIAKLTLNASNGLPALQQCILSGNQIPGELKLAESTSLSMLWCDNNELTRMTLPTRKLTSLMCENNQLSLNSFPYYRYKPENLSYLPQRSGVMDISSALLKASNGAYYAPLCEKYSDRNNNSYRINLSEYAKDANGQSSINVTFFKYGEGESLVELTKATAGAQTNEYFAGTGSSVGYYTFLQPQERIWAVFTSDYYPGLEVSSIHFSVGEEGTVGIENILAGDDAFQTEAAYDLQGRRVLNPRHGLYIVGGKKVYIK